MGNAMNILRTYSALYVPLLLLTGAFILYGRELGKHPVPPADNIVGVMIICAGLFEAIAVLWDHDTGYRISYIVTCVALAPWTFVLAVYAAYGLQPWGRVVVFAFVLVDNMVMQPVLLADRAADRALNKATDNAWSRRESRESGQGDPT